ncbi:MAG: hypothetical protein ACRCV0_00960 [Brevinema sp.]
MKDRIIFIIFFIITNACNSTKSSENMNYEELKNIQEDTTDDLRKKIANKTFITSKESESDLNMVFNNQIQSTVYFDKFKTIKSDSNGTILIDGNAIGQGSPIKTLCYKLERALDKDTGIFQILYVNKNSSFSKNGEVNSIEDKTVIIDMDSLGRVQIKLFNKRTHQYILFATERKNKM